MAQSSNNYEVTLDRLTAQNHMHMKVMLRLVYTEVKTMSGSRGQWHKMIMRFVDKDGRGIYAELRGDIKVITRAAEPSRRLGVQKFFLPAHPHL